MLEKIEVVDNEKPESTPVPVKRGLSLQVKVMAIVTGLLLIIIITALYYVLNTRYEMKLAGVDAQEASAGYTERGATSEQPISDIDAMGDYLGRSGTQGPDPAGEFAWAADFGDTFIGDPVAVEGVVYLAVIERVKVTQDVPVEIHSTAKVVAVDLMKGEALWERLLPEAGRYDSAEILPEGNYVYVVAYIRDTGIAITKHDASELGEFAWDKPLIIEWMKPRGSVIAGGMLITSMEYVAGGVYRLIAADTTTGAVKWGQSIGWEPGPPCATPDGFGVVETAGNQDAQFVVRTLRGDEALRIPLGFTGQWGAPVIANGKLLAAGQWSFGRCMVECYDFDNLWGDPLWRWDARFAGDMPPSTGFVVIGDRCAFIGPPGKLALLNMPDGKSMLAEGAVDYEYVTPPSSNGNLLFGATSDGHITAIQVSDGTLKWDFELPQRMTPLKGRALAYRDGRLFCACKGGVLVALK